MVAQAVAGRNGTAYGSIPARSSTDIASFGRPRTSCEWLINFCYFIFHAILFLPRILSIHVVNFLCRLSSVCLCSCISFDVTSSYIGSRTVFGDVCGMLQIASIGQEWVSSLSLKKIYTPYLLNYIFLILNSCSILLVDFGKSFGFHLVG